mgnify:CR=1 FL=1
MEDNEKIIVETEVVDKEFGYNKKTTKQVIHEDYFNVLNGFLNLSALVAFLLLGIIGNFWYCAWIVFFVPDIICSIVRAIKKRRFCMVNVLFISCAVFFFVCMAVPGMSANLWHPMWVVFLLVPVWYIVFGRVDEFIHRCD